MNLRIAAENKFEGCERDELVVYCNVLAIEVLDGHNVGHLKKKLLDTLGEYHEFTLGASTEPKAEQKALEDVNIADLNLSSTGTWQGRRRVVTLHRAAAYDSVYPLFLAWESLHVYMPYGVTASLPWPIWMILRETSNAKKLIRKRQTDDDGRISYREEWVPDQPFMYTDGGDDPDTVLLPQTMIKAVRLMYHASEGLKDYNERQLREVCRRLRIGVRRDWTRADISMAIQTTISIPVSMGEASGGVTAAELAAT